MYVIEEAGLEGRVLFNANVGREKKKEMTMKVM